MAENKKSFLLYCDLIHTVDKMPDDKAGLLLKHILKYVNDLNPVTDDLIIQLTFEPVKQQLKRDLQKWEGFVKKQSENGKLGGRPKSQDNPNKGLGFLDNPNEPKKAVTVTVTDNVKVNVKENDITARKLKFSQTLEPFLSVYGKNMLNDFYLYWTEVNPSETKFRKENEKFWDLKRRLETWNKRQKIEPITEPKTTVKKL